MTYAGILERRPKTTDQGDVSAAKSFAAFLDTVFADEAFLKGLTDSNRNYLYKLRAIWKKRAAGEDESWNQGGSRPGRRRKNSDTSSQTIRSRHTLSEEERTYDDLSKRVIEKFANVIAAPHLTTDADLDPETVADLRARLRARLRGLQ